MYLDDILATEEITEEEFDLGDFSADDDAIIWWSSGSTGRNNGVAVIKSTQPESFFKTKINRIFCNSFKD